MTSPNQPDPAGALGAARTLTLALTGLSERLDAVKQDSENRDKALTTYGRANRHRIWVTYALLTVDIALTVLVGIFAGQAHSAALVATHNRQASATACASGDGLRTALNQVFDHVFGSFGPPAGTPAQKAVETARLKALEAYYHGKFAPLNCTAIYGVAPATKAGPTGKAG